MELIDQLQHNASVAGGSSEVWHAALGLHTAEEWMLSHPQLLVSLVVVFLFSIFTSVFIGKITLKNAELPDSPEEPLGHAEKTTLEGFDAEMYSPLDEQQIVALLARIQEPDVHPDAMASAEERDHWKKCKRNLRAALRCFASHIG